MNRIRTALVVALLVALPGCGADDPEPKIAPSPSTSPSSAAGTPSASAEPALSPEETVRAWVEARNQAMLTGDTEAVEALSAPGCESCENWIQPIREVYAAGGFFKTTGWKVPHAKVRESSTDDRAAVDVALVIAGGRTVPAASAEPVVYEVNKRIAVFRLAVESDGRWLVRFIGFYS